MPESKGTIAIIHSIAQELKARPAMNEEPKPAANPFLKKYPKDNKLHICVGIYPNGDMVTNTVHGSHLADNVKYNDDFRPGRFYFVDGEYACGGMLKEPFQSRRIAEIKEKIKDVKPENHDSAPYH